MFLASGRWAGEAAPWLGVLWDSRGARALRGGWEKTLQRNERRPLCSSEAKDQTSPGGHKMDQVKGVDGEVGEVPERCFSSSVLDNPVGKGVRGEGRREERGDDGLDRHPDFRGAQ